MNRSILSTVNDAERVTEDALDLEEFEERSTEPVFDFESVVAALKRADKL
jgi:hypothetical protein